MKRLTLKPRRLKFSDTKITDPYQKAVNDAVIEGRDDKEYLLVTLLNVHSKEYFKDLPENKWIPISKSLPPNDSRQLLLSREINGKNEYFMIYHSSHVFLKLYLLGKYCDKWSSLIDFKEVKHFMILEEPPQ